MQLFLQGSPLTELTVTKSDGSIMFIVETHPYLEDQRTEVYDQEGDVLGSILWNGTQPSHICVYSESATHLQPFEMIPRGDPARQDEFEVVAGDGTHEMLWVVDRNGLCAHYPMLSRTNPQRPPLVAEFIPKRGPAGKSTAPPQKRKLSEMDCDSLMLAVEELSDDALGRFWVAFVLLDIIRKSKFRIPVDEPLARLQNQKTLATSSRSNVGPSGSQGAHPSNAAKAKLPKAKTGWSVRNSTGRLKDLTIGMMLQPRRWSL